MDAYTGFADVYDQFMDNVPYDEWGDYLHTLMLEQGVREGLVAELGCGTGSMTEVLAGYGYDMIGIDLAEEMLAIAQAKKDSSGYDILYLCQDMREFELYGTVKAIVSICDSLNYILSEADLEQVFRQVNNYLDPGGVFIFDLNTSYKYGRILGDTTIAENREECSFIWENTWFEEEEINEYDLTIFNREADGRYCKYEEVHYQKAYSLETVKQLLNTAGLTFMAAYDAFTKEPPHNDSERIYIIAKENKKG